MRDEEQYKKLKQKIRKLCRQAKDKYFEDKCKEIEMLDKAHSQLMYQKIKELRPKGNRGLQTIKSKQGNVLMKSEEPTSELQSLAYLVCRLLLEKKKKNNTNQ